MTRALGFVLVAWMLTAVTCATTSGGGGVSSACPSTVGSASAHFSMAQQLLGGARQGEHYDADGFDAGSAEMLEAARGGHLEAQYDYGALIIGVRYVSRAPSPDSADDHAAYVGALTWLAVASRRGHAGVEAFLPAPVLSALLNPEELAASGDDEPFADLPRAWVSEAGAQAAAWDRCW